MEAWVTLTFKEKARGEKKKKGQKSKKEYEE